MSDNRPTVSAIIVTCNSLPSLRGCLKALRASSEGYRLELVAVDNASDDDSAQAIGEYFPNCNPIKNDRNRGFAAACNQGAESAAGEYLLFLNPDVVIDPEAIGELLKTFELHPEAGLVSGRLRFPDGSFQATCRNFPTVTNMVFSRGSLFSKMFGEQIDRKGRYTLPDYKKTTEVPSVAATMLMVRKELFDEVGGFDPRFFVFMEDTDLSLRVSQHGLKNYVVPSAGGTHVWGTGSKAGRFRRQWHHHHSLWQYFLKHQPNGFSVILLPVLLLLNLMISMLLPGGGKRP